MTGEHPTRSHRAAGVGLSVGRGSHPAVLVVDFSCGFTDPECALGCDLSAAVEATRRLLEAARATGTPVIFTTIGFEPGLKDAGLWPRKMPALADLQIGGRWVTIDPRLGARVDEPIILKKGASAFFGTNLAAILVSQKIDSVVLCGATTSGCVRATAVDLLQHGYPTFVPRECVGDRAPDRHEGNLFDIECKYADVGSLEEALEYLQRVASTGSAPLRTAF